MLHFVALVLHRGRAVRHLFADPRQKKKKGKTPDRLTRGRRTSRRGRVHHRLGIVGNGRWRGPRRRREAAKCEMKAAISGLRFDQEAAAVGPRLPAE